MSRGLRVEGIIFNFSSSSARFSRQHGKYNRSIAAWSAQTISRWHGGQQNRPSDVRSQLILVPRGPVRMLQWRCSYESWVHWRSEGFSDLLQPVSWFIPLLTLYLSIHFNGFSCQSTQLSFELTFNLRFVWHLLAWTQVDRKPTVYAWNLRLFSLFATCVNLQADLWISCGHWPPIAVCKKRRKFSFCKFALTCVNLRVHLARALVGKYWQRNAESVCFESCPWASLPAFVTGISHILTFPRLHFIYFPGCIVLSASAQIVFLELIYWYGLTHDTFGNISSQMHWFFNICFASKLQFTKCTQKYEICRLL